MQALSSLTNGFSLQSPLPAPTLLIVNHLSDLRYSLPVPDFQADGGLLTTGIDSTRNRTYRHYLLSADPLLSSINHQEPEDDLLNELRQSSSILDSIASTRMQRAQVGKEVVRFSSVFFEFWLNNGAYRSKSINRFFYVFYCFLWEQVEGGSCVYLGFFCAFSVVF